MSEAYSSRECATRQNEIGVGASSEAGACPNTKAPFPLAIVLGKELRLALLGSFPLRPVMNRTDRHMELSANFNHCHSSLSGFDNVADLILRKLGAVQSVFRGVTAIKLRRRPLQVAYPIVGAVAVQVIDYRLIQMIGQLKESFGNQPV